MYQLAFEFFSGFLANNVELEECVHGQQDFFIEDDSLIFSLPALHNFLNQSSKKKIPYQDFKRQLYQSTLNQDLKAYGAQIVVHHSTGKVETNLYRLERITPTDSSG